MILQVEDDIRSNVHHCLKKQLAIGQIKLSPVFERLRDGAIDSLEEYEALWQLGSLTAKSLHGYTPKMDHTHQQQCVAVAISSYSHSVMPVSA
jgi:hypothetical protein